MHRAQQCCNARVCHAVDDRPRFPSGRYKLSLAEFGQLLGERRLSDAGGVLQSAHRHFTLRELAQQQQAGGSGHEAQQLGHLGHALLHRG